MTPEYDYSDEAMIEARNEEMQTKTLPIPSIEALQLAAQAWCDPEAADIEMDSRLATAFARILDQDRKDKKWEAIDAIPLFEGLHVLDVAGRLLEQYQNAMSVADKKEGDDKSCWLDDARHYKAALHFLNQLIDIAQPK